ncbi:hypothetical protein R3P38DRAFT_161857 [Favolaschia claudopus]|uniref:Transmembrane protein n=1 Tax=Favolaschia claudopus TaxID=2862362 RepID=A0AAW0CZP1_9AGAR
MSSWNFTIDDTSPFLTYIPYADGSNSGLTNGWVPWYDTSGFLTKNGNAGVGASYHITSSQNNASVAFEFYGNAVYLYGTTNASYSVIIDGSTSQHTPPSSPDLLFQKTGLDTKTHSVTLSATPNDPAQQFAFDRAVISAPLTDKNAPKESFYDNLDTAHINYSGTWTTPTAAGIPNTSVTHPWHTTKETASATMEIGKGAVGVSLWGMANWGNWVYQVSLDGTNNSYNGSTFFQVPDALLFHQGGLDPTVNHNISIKNVSPGMNLALNSIRVFTVDEGAVPPSSSGFIASPSSSAAASTSKSSSVNAGAVAGGVIGALVLLAGLALIWWCLRRRRRRAADAPENGKTEGYFYNDQLQPYSDGEPSFVSAGNEGAPLSTTTENGTMASPSFTTSLTGLTSTAGPRSEAALSSSSATATATGTDRSGTHGAGGGFGGSEKRRQLVMASLPSPTQSAAELPASPTTTATAPTPGAPVGLAPTDVDRLVELIAQRIDPRQNINAGNRESAGAPPPEYRG